MNQLEKARTGSPNGGAFLDQLAGHGILLPKRDELEAYVALHLDLAMLLDGMCKKVRAAFGPTAELSLEMYSDPDFDDRYPTLYVRQQSYAPDIMDCLDSVYAEFHRPLEAVSGYFLVTTDFRRPRGANCL
jgi:hypothetical protein